MHKLNLQYIVFIFITGDVLELLASVFLFRYVTKVSIAFKWDKAKYLQLLHESLPQTGVVLITSALARFDWIFIGVMVSVIKLAEYSFAYKIFEISTLPLLAVAPLLIPRFTKIFQRESIPIKELQLLVRIEMIVAAFIALLLTICWAPVIDSLTAGKYGLINVKTIFILSLCMPLLYLNNFLWTIYFAQGRLKMIFTSFIITFSVNVGGDILLIPFFKNEGAAFAFFVACAAQTVYYLKKNDINQFGDVWHPLVVCTLGAFTSGFIAEMLFSGCWPIVPLAVTIYAALLFITGQFTIQNLIAAKRLFKP